MVDVDDSLRRERTALRDWLAAHGASAEQIAACELAAAERGREPEGLASDLVLARGVTLTARDLADRLGLDVVDIVAIYRDLGVVVPDVDAAQFTEDDAMLVTRLLRATSAGDIPSTTSAELLRVVAGAMDRIAEAAVAIYVQGPEEDLRRRGAPSSSTPRTLRTPPSWFCTSAPGWRPSSATTCAKPSPGNESRRPG
jgi:hypothetical protein